MPNTANCHEGSSGVWEPLPCDLNVLARGRRFLVSCRDMRDSSSPDAWSALPHEGMPSDQAVPDFSVQAVRRRAHPLSVSHAKGVDVLSEASRQWPVPVSSWACGGGIGFAVLIAAQRSARCCGTSWLS